MGKELREGNRGMVKGGKRVGKKVRVKGGKRGKD